jgi:hypothetical protein
MVFDHAVFNHGDSGDQRLVVYAPTGEQDTPAKLARLLEEDALATASAAAAA